MSFEKTARLAVGASLLSLLACSTPTAPDAVDIDGTYALQSASGRGPTSGSLILTRQGYAERRVRFRLPSGALSKEYLARGTVTVRPDNTLSMELREMDMTSDLPWTPGARMVNGGIEIRYPDAGDGADIIETYTRRK